MTFWQFLHPWFLVFLVLPVALLIYQYYQMKRQPTTLVYSDLSVFEGVPLSLKQMIYMAMPFVRFVILSLAIIALARPQFGTIERNVSTVGIDISLVIDVSGSMQAQDYLPNRLEVAKQSAIDFVRTRTNDRVSVVLFAVGEAVLCPPTMDMGAVEMFIRAVYLGIIDSRGTAIGLGISRALKIIQDSDVENKVIILLTDGVNNSGDITPMQSAEAARAMGVRVYTIGIGTPARSGMRGGDVFDEDLLIEIADLTNARYYWARDEASLSNIYREIDALEGSTIEVKESADFDEKFYLFWVPGLLLLGMEFLLKAFWLRRLP